MSPEKNTPENKNGAMLSTREVAKRLNVAQAHVRKLCREGKLEGELVGNVWFVKQGSLAAFETERAKAKAIRVKELSEQRKQESELFRSGRVMIPARQAAKRLGVAQGYIRKLCREGELEGQLVANAWFVSEASIAQFEAARTRAKIERSEELSELRRQENELLRKSQLLPEVVESVEEREESFSLFTTYPFTRNTTLALGGLLLFAAVAFAGAGYAQRLGGSLVASLSHIQSPFFGMIPSAPQIVQNIPPVTQTPPVTPIIATTTQTIVQNNTYPVTEHTIVKTQSGITQADLDAQLSQLANSLHQEIYNFIHTPQPVTTYTGNTFQPAVLTLDDASIPDNITVSGYLPLSGGTITGLLTVSGLTTLSFASTTALSISGTASTTDLVVSSLGSLGTTCVQADITGKLSSTGSACGAGGGTTDFNYIVNYGVIAAATSSPLWAQNGIFASSTSHFANADFANATSTSFAVTGSTTVASILNIGGALNANSTLTVLGNTSLQQATSTNLAITSIASGNLLKTTTGGAVIAAVVGTDYATPSQISNAFPFTPGTSYGVNVNSTSTPIAFTQGIFASSTSHFVTLDFAGATSTGTFAVSASTTLAGLLNVGGALNANSTLTVLGGTSLQGATSTSFGITSIASGNILKTTTGGAIVAAVAGTDYLTSASAFAYPFPGDATSTQIAFNGGLTTTGATSTGTFAVTSSTTLSSLLNVGGALNANGTLTALGNTSLQQATSTTFAISSISSGNLLKTTTGGAVIAAVAGTDYLTTATLPFTYPFPNGATSSPLMLLASTTIGDGTQTGGLTVSGGATTTGTAYFVGNVGVGTSSPAFPLSSSGTKGVYTNLTANSINSDFFRGVFGGINQFRIGFGGGGEIQFTVNDTVDNTNGNYFIQKNGESFARAVFGRSFLGFGPGSATRDVFLNRSAVSTLTISSDQGSGAANLIINGNSTTTNATTTALAISGVSSGSLLKTTTGGAVIAAVSGSDYLNTDPNWAMLNGALTPTTTTLGVGIFGSSTIGGGTQTTGLTINGGSTTTLNAYFASRVGIGTSSPVFAVDVIKTLTSGQSDFIRFNPGNTNDAKLGVVNLSGTNFPGIWFSQTAPTVSNYTFLFDTANALSIVNAPSGGGVNFRINNNFASQLTYDASGNLRLGAAFNGTSVATLDVRGTGVVSQKFSVASTSPFAMLSVHATSTTGTNAPTTLFAVASSTGGTATSTLFSISNTGSTTLFQIPSSILKTDSNGTIVGAIVGTDYLTTATLPFTYPFPNGATSSPLMLLASTTIGAGGQATGLTISGGATTTGRASIGLNGSTTNAIANLVVRSDGSTRPAIAIVGKGTNGSSPDDNNSGTIIFPGWNQTLGNKQLVIGASDDWGSASKYGFRYITGFAIPMIDGLSMDGNTRGNINLGYIDNNVGFGFDVVSAVQTDIAGKVHIRGETAGTKPLEIIQNFGSTGDFLQLRNTAGAVLSSVSRNGYFGIGTSSPYALLSVFASSTGAIPGNTLFAIGSSTASATSTLFSISNTGSTTAANGINIATGCFAINNNCLTSAAFSFPFTPTTNFGVNVNSTSTPIWFAAGLQASTTSHFTNLDYSGTLGIATSSSNASSTIFTFNGQTFITASSTGFNTSLGLSALSNITSGNKNTALGYRALINATTSSENVAIGYQALSSSLLAGGRNVAIGSQALTSNTTGNNNIAIGYSALSTTVSGTDNVGIGSSVCSSNDCIRTVAIGTSASLEHSTDGVLIGYNAGNGGGGLGNVGIGSGALGAGSFIGSQNTAIGYQAGLGILGGGYSNIIVGASNLFSAGPQSSASRNIGIGNDIYFQTPTGNDQLNIGNILYGTLPATSTAFVLPTSGALGAGTSSPFAKFSIHTNNGDANKTLFAIGSSTASATTTLFSVSNIGQIGTNLDAGTSTLVTLGGRSFIVASSSNGVSNGRNTALGLEALSRLTSGGSNTALGYLALSTATSTSKNTAIGSLAMSGNVFGTGNTAIGWSALSGGGLGYNTVALGSGIFSLSVSGGYNIGIGTTFQNYAVSGDSNIGIGSLGFDGGAVSGTGNIGIGDLTYNGGAINYGYNVALGYSAANSLSSNSGQNVLLGGYAGQNLSSNASNNIFVGFNTLAKDSSQSNSLNIGNLLFGTLPATTSATSLSLPTTGTFGIGTSSPTSKFGIASNNGDTLTTLFQISSSTASATTTLFQIDNTGTASTTNFVVSALGSGAGNCVTVNATGLLSTQSCSGGAFAYDAWTHPSAGVSATTSQIIISASSTIGNGTQAGGLTVSGGSTTTLNAYFASKIGIGTTSPGHALSVVGTTTSTGGFNVDSNTNLLSYQGSTSLAVSPSDYNLFAGLGANGSTTKTGINQLNVFLGSSAGYGAVTQASVYIGAYSGFGSTTGATNSGNFNTAVGASTLRYNSTGFDLAAFGSSALQNNTTGSDNSAFGYNSLANNTSGFFNSAVGSNALVNNVSGSNNSAFGVSALLGNTTGSSNTAVGQTALINLTTGSSNTAVGKGAIVGASNGSSNTAVGASALSGLGVTNSFNSALGAGAGVNGTGTVAVGYNSGFSGSFNSSVGFTAGFNVTGDMNTLLGYSSGFNVGSGYGNIGIGASSTQNITTGFNNIGIGNNTYFSSASASNQLNLGNLLFGTIPATSTALVLPTTGSLGIGTTSPWAKFSIATNNGDTNKVLFAVGSSTASATTTLFTILNTGFVGVGTSTPWARLSVMANNGEAPATLFAIGSSTSATTTNFLTVNSSGILSVGNDGSNQFTVDATTGSTSIANLTLGNIRFDPDAGLVALSDIPVVSAASGVQQAQVISIGGNPVLTVSGISNGSGGLNNLNVSVGTSTAPYSTLQVWGSNFSNLTSAFAVVNSASSTVFNVFNGGNVGIGTTTPSGTLSLHANNGSTNTTLFAIGSSTASATTTLFSISNTGLASTTSLIISSAGGTPGCATFDAVGTISNTGTACGTGAGGAFPFTPTTSFGTAANSTSTLLLLTNGLSASSTVRFGNAGVAGQFVWDSAMGALGIGTSTPHWALELASSTAAQLTLTGSGNNLFSFREAGGFLYIGTSSPTTFATSTYPALTITSSGFIGVGTSTPWAKLSVMANNGESNTTLFAIGSSTSATTTTFLTVNNSGIFSVGNDNSNQFTVDAGTGSTSIANLTIGNLVFDTNAGVVNLSDLPVDSNAAAGVVQSQSIAMGGNPFLTIYSESNGGGGIRNTTVGIGTTTPWALFSIAASQSASSTGKMLFTIASSTAAGVSRDFLSINNIGNVGVSSTTPWATFAVNPVAGTASNQFVVGSSSATNFIITNSGAVGIGTTSPWRTFSASGTVSLSGLTNDTADAQVLCLTADKEVVANNGASCITSSQRFKNSIASSTTGLSEVLAMQAVTFNYNSNVGVPGQQLGFIAEQVQEIDPRLVVLDGDGNPFSVKYENYTAVLTKAIQQINGVVSVDQAPQGYSSIYIDSAGDITLGGTATSTLTINSSVVHFAGPATTTIQSGSNVWSLATSSIGTPILSISTGTTSILAVNGAITAQSIEVSVASTSQLCIGGICFGGQEAAALASIATSTASSTENATSTLTGTDIAGNIMQAILSRLNNFGIYISQAFTRFTDLFADNFTAGSSAVPAGITLYDKATGEPYCLSVTNGQSTVTSGVCINTAPTGAAPADSGSGASSPPPDTGTASSTPDVAPPVDSGAASSTPDIAPPIASDSSATSTTP